MADPFQAAVETIFASALATPALYIPAAGPVLAIRTIRQQPSAEGDAGGMRVVVSTNEFQLMRSVVAEPGDGDRLVLLDAAGAPIAGETHQLMGTPMLDAEGLTWTCEAEPV